MCRLTLNKVIVVGLIIYISQDFNQTNHKTVIIFIKVVDGCSSAEFTRLYQQNNIIFPTQIT